MQIKGKAFAEKVVAAGAAGQRSPAPICPSGPEVDAVLAEALRLCMTASAASRASDRLWPWSSSNSFFEMMQVLAKI